MASNQVPVNCVGVTGTHAGLRLQIAANQQFNKIDHDAWLGQAVSKKKWGK